MAEGFFSPVELGQVKVKPRLPQCGKCRLYIGCKSPKMKLAGEGRKKIMVVGEAPGREEDINGKPFVGVSGRELQRALAKCEIDLFKDCWVTNTIACRPTDNDLPEKAITHCQPKVLREIEELKPVVIIVLGTPAVKSIIGHLWKEDTRGIQRWAGFQIPCRQWNAWVSPTFHPSYVLRSLGSSAQIFKGDPVPQILFERHLKAAVVKTARPWSNVPDYRKEIEVILDANEAADRIDKYINMVAFDYETTTLKPDGPHAEIVCCSVSDGKTSIAYPWSGKAIEATCDLLTDPNIHKIGYNNKFEMRWSQAKLGIKVRGWVWDGMLAAHALDSRSGVSGLKFQSFCLLGQEDYDSQLKPYLKATPEGGNNPNRIRELPIDEVCRYCATDSLCEFRVAQAQAKELGVEL